MTERPWHASQPARLPASVDLPTPPFELTNEITATHDFYLHDIKFSDFNDNPTLFFEFSLLTADKKKAEFFETSLKLKGKQIFQRVEEMKKKLPL